MATFKRVRTITRTVLRLTENETVYFTIEGPIYLGESSASQKREPPSLIDVIDLETGEAGIVVAPLLLREHLNEGYPDNSYVGKSFEVTALSIKKSESGTTGYRQLQIYEIEAAVEPA